LLPVQNAHFSGLQKRDDLWVYVSEGAVGWGERVRFLSTPEMTVITLRTEGTEPSGDVGVRTSQVGAGLALAVGPVYLAVWGAVIVSRCRVRYGGDPPADYSEVLSVA
jgi:hypothetical protein